MEQTRRICQRSIFDSETNRRVSLEHKSYNNCLIAYMQASVIASIIYLHYNCLLYVQVFVHEAIHHAELNICFNNQHLLINISHNINTELQSSNT